MRGTAAGANASLTQGWVVGHFGEGLGKSDDVEIKLWRYDANPDYGLKRFDGTEFIYIQSGRLRIETVINGTPGMEELDSAKEEYIILPPGTVKRVIALQVPAFGVTVRWPSKPAGNKIL